jgi:hypothetical protein
VKVRNIAASLESIKINNKYADIRLPMRNVKSYSVAYVGAYSTVYAGFEKKPMEEKEIANKTSTLKESAVAGAPRPNTNRYSSFGGGDGEAASYFFTATVGDGKGAKLDLKCQNCTVDFK